MWGRNYQGTGVGGLVPWWFSPPLPARADRQGNGPHGDPRSGRTPCYVGVRALCRLGRDAPTCFLGWAWLSGYVCLLSVSYVLWSGLLPGTGDLCPKPRKGVLPVGSRRRARTLCVWLTLVTAALALLTSLVQFGETLVNMFAR